MKRSIAVGLAIVGLSAVATGAAADPSAPAANENYVPVELGDSASVAPRPLAWALNAAERGDWIKAAEIARRDGPAAEILVEWQRLRSGAGTPETILAFLNEHDDWPGLTYLRRLSEPTFAGADPEEVVAFFREQAPQTGKGVLLFADALEKTGHSGEAQATIVLAWRVMDLSDADHAAFTARYSDLLEPHHAARLEMAFWKDLSDDAARMKGLVPDGDWALYQARRAAMRGASDADEKIAALPKAKRNDAGIAYARFAALAKAGKDEQAMDLMMKQSGKPGGLGDADRWAGQRRLYAREEMQAGNFMRAYALAAGHQTTSGSAFADMEWFAGYVALRKLGDAERALTHFKTLREGVQTPISLGRAYYWQGRALEDLGREDEAQRAYEAGGRYQTTFYGLLAAEKAGMPIDATLAGADRPTQMEESLLKDSLVREAGMLLLAAGKRQLGEQFLVHLADQLGPKELAELGAMLEDMGEPHLEVMLGKSGAERGIVLPRHYYALHPLGQMDLPVVPEMALAIARRESEFDPGVSSHVGAGGLMQLMPATAKEVAQGLGMRHDPSAVLSDWSYNALLGSAYLAGLGQRFDGNVLLVSAGYNAGPGRSDQWIRAYGDPRSDDVDVVDWIEHIPFGETRNYVQRVAESLPVYRARLGQNPLPVPFTAELKGSSVLPPTPLAEEREEARADN